MLICGILTLLAILIILFRQVEILLRRPLKRLVIVYCRTFCVSSHLFAILLKSLRLIVRNLRQIDIQDALLLDRSLDVVEQLLRMLLFLVALFLLSGSAVVAPLAVVEQVS